MAPFPKLETERGELVENQAAFLEVLNKWS